MAGRLVSRHQGSRSHFSHAVAQGGVDTFQGAVSTGRFETVPWSTGKAVLSFARAPGSYEKLTFAQEEQQERHVPQWGKKFPRTLFQKKDLFSYTNFPCKNPSAGSGRHVFGKSARRIGVTE